MDVKHTHPWVSSSASKITISNNPESYHFTATLGIRGWKFHPIPRTLIAWRWTNLYHNSYLITTRLAFWPSQPFSSYLHPKAIEVPLKYSNHWTLVPKPACGSDSSIGNQYAPHNTAVEARSVSLKWHLRLSSKCHSAFHIPSIPGPWPACLKMMSVPPLRTSTSWGAFSFASRVLLWITSCWANPTWKSESLKITVLRPELAACP